MRTLTLRGLKAVYNRYKYNQIFLESNDIRLRALLLEAWEWTVHREDSRSTVPAFRPAATDNGSPSLNVASAERKYPHFVPGRHGVRGEGELATTGEGQGVV